MNATRKPAESRRKLIEFDQETWQALDLLARESMKSVQELADEAFRDLLRKHGRPTDLKACAEGERPTATHAVVRKTLRPPQRSLACAQVAGGGAKKHRRVPSGRLQRQNAPSGEGCASVKGIFSFPKIR